MPLQDPLDEREFELINIIGKQLGSNQRDLSDQMKLSLGQTNMLIRRLVSKGYIRIMQLNKKKVQYLLTPKGISEKLRKSVKYTINTINSIGLIRSRLQAVFNDLYGQGHRKFVVLGSSDLVILVEMVYKELNLSGSSLERLAEESRPQAGEVVLIATEYYSEKNNDNIQVNLVEELAKEMALR